MDTPRLPEREQTVRPSQGADRFDSYRLPFKAQLLAVLTVLGAGSLMESSVEAAPAVQVEAPDLPLDSIHDETWSLTVDGVEKVQITNRYGETLYAFIKGELRKQNAFPNKMTKGNEDAIVTALITACRQLNPGLRLDDFDSIRDQKIVFPVSFDFHYYSDSPEKSEKALVDLAEMDGYPIDQPKQRDRLYYNALKEGVSWGDSEGLFQLPGYEKSPDYFLEDAYEMLRGVDLCLVMSSKVDIEGDRSMHWLYSYTEALRGSRLQALEDPSAMENIHYTGRALDVSDGSFLSPYTADETVSWRKNKELRSTIEHRLRPTIEGCFEEEGAALYHNKKGGFYDVYFPKKHTVTLSF